MKFEVDDVEREWAYPFKFDYVVSRQMAGSLADWPKLAEQIYEYVGTGILLAELANYYYQKPKPRRLGRVPGLRPRILLRRRDPHRGARLPQVEQNLPRRPYGLQPPRVPGSQPPVLR